MGAEGEALADQEPGLMPWMPLAFVVACCRDTELMRRNLALLIVIGCMVAAVVILLVVPR
jgi:hypothetical protein